MAASAIAVSSLPDPAVEPHHGVLPSTGTIDTTTDADTGLTASEVAAQRANGLGNRVDDPSSRTYKQIVRENLFTFLNVSLFAIGAVLLLLGLFRDAIMSSGFAFINAAMGIVQEMIAKRRLDKVALLSRAKARAIRDGEAIDLDPSDLVLGDILELQMGDQAVIDGVAVVSESAQVDESLLTGEADAVPKAPGSPIYSGSFLVSGTLRYQATQMSENSVASGIVADAKTLRMSLTPLQQSVNAIIRLLLAIAFTMLGMLIVSSIVWEFPFRETVVAAAVVLGVVPAGLFMMITITYSMATLRLARQNALIQHVNAVESLSNVTIFCMDKTGTLTANALEVQKVRPIRSSAGNAEAALGAFAHSVTSTNKTSAAIADAFDAAAAKVVDEVPFSSARKWSAVAIDGDVRGTFALGAPEMLGPLLASSPGDPPAEWLEHGLRVLLFASSSEPRSLHQGEEPALPPLEPLAWLAIADTLRPHIRETLKGFADAGIEVKVISGDNPETVAALARQAGLTGNLTLVSGVELAEMTGAQFDAAAKRGRIFGRITPDQKAQLVEALQRTGAYVAMTGDGVNDVMSLKKANLGISMESGSQATRAVADIILMQDTFSAIPAAFREGQRVRRGLQGVLELFLARVFVVVLALMLCSIVRVGFPFAPANVALLTLLTVGIPTFGIALWAHPRAPARSLVHEVVAFVVPATITLALAGFVIYTIFYLLADVSLADLRSGEAFGLMSGNPISRDALTTLLVLAGIGLVPLACPPTDWWAVVEPTDHDWRPTILAALMIPLFAVILRVDGLRNFFDANNLGVGSYLVIGIVAVGWLVLLRYAYATHVFERFFGLQIPDRPE